MGLHELILPVILLWSLVYVPRRNSVGNDSELIDLHVGDEDDPPTISRVQNYGIVSQPRDDIERIP